MRTHEAPPPAATDGSVTRALSHNAAVSMAGKVIYLASRVALPPVILHHMSLEEYGIWACSFVVISYLGMGAFGVSNVYVRYVAEYHARGETERINRLVSTGLVLTTGIGAILLGLLWWALPAVLPLLNIPAELQERAFLVVFAACAVFLVELSVGAFGHVLIGLHRLAAQTVVWVGTSVLEAVLIVALLAGGGGVYGLLAAFAARLSLAVVAYAVLCARALPGLSVRLRHVDRESLRLFCGYGTVVQLAGVLGIFLYSVEKVIAGLFLGVGAAGLFDVGEKFAVMVSGIPASLNGALLPAISHLNRTAAREQARELYLAASRCISLFGGLLMAFLAAFAGPVIAAWLGASEEYRDAALILAVFSLAFHMHVVTGPGSALYRGVGAPARELFYPLVQLGLVAVSVAAGFALVGRTVAVVAVSVAGSMVLSAALYEAYTNRYLGIRQWAYFRQVWLPGLLPYGVGFAIAALLEAGPGSVAADRVHALAVLFGGGALYAVIVLPLLYGVICRESERAVVRAAVARLLPPVLARRVPALLPLAGSTGQS